jgi:alpha-L-arabinofuranosidase
VKDGALQQTNNERETWITIGDENWTDYTMKLKARKLSGDEGFLILFHGRDPQNYLWFNIGGWGNSRTAIEHASDGEKSNVGEDSDFTVQDNKWYDIKIELSGREIKCYIDDKPIIQATQTPPAPLPSLYAAASKVEASGEVILKVVNAGETPQQVEIALRGAKDVAKEARLSVMSGEPGDVNTVADPTKVAPKDSTISNAAANFTHEFPANSVSVIRLKAK